MRFNRYRSFASYTVLFVAFFVLNSCGSLPKMNERGFKKIENKEYTKAKDIFLKILEKDKKNAEAYYGLGILAFEMKKYEDAVSLFKEAINLGHKKAIKHRGASYYYISQKEYALGYIKSALVSINKSLDDFPTLESSLELRAKLLLENVNADIENKFHQGVIRNYGVLLKQDQKYLNPISEELKSLEPKVRVFLAEYNFSKGNDALALMDLEVILTSNTKYMNRYRLKALRLKSEVYEYKSKTEYRRENYHLALQYIEEAILNSSREELVYQRAFIYGKQALKQFKKNNLPDALRLINLAIRDGNRNGLRGFLKLRSQIYFAMAVKEKNLERLVDLCELALDDDKYNTETKAYIYNLYLTKVAELIDVNRYDKAKDMFKKATEIDNAHRVTYNMFTNNLNDKESIFFDAAVAEIYAINLRYKEAIDQLKKHLLTTHRYKPQLYYTLAKYYALNNQKIDAYLTLTQFYTERSMRDYYIYYREKAMDDPSFISLQNNSLFYKWLNGINRVKLSLNYIQNIPKKDITSESDSYLQIFQNSRRLLSTLKAQDQANISWPEDLYHVVFDYDFDDPLIFKLVDSDLTTDSFILPPRSYTKLYPGGWNVILNEKTDTVLNIDITDCSSCASEYSTYTDLPPKGSVFASLEDSRIRGGENSISTVYIPKLAEEYSRVYQSYFFVSGLTESLAPCFGTFAVALSKRGFVIKQVFYWLFQSANDIDYNKFTFEAFLEYMLNKVGNSFLVNANNFRVFCDCAYNSIKK